MVADGRQRGGRQFRCACQPLTAAKHERIATLRQCGSAKHEVFRRMALDRGVGIGRIVTAEETGEVHIARQYSIVGAACETHHVTIDIYISSTLDLVTITWLDVAIRGVIATEG